MECKLFLKEVCSSCFCPERHGLTLNCDFAGLLTERAKIRQGRPCAKAARRQAKDPDGAGHLQAFRRLLRISSNSPTASLTVPFTSALYRQPTFLVAHPTNPCIETQVYPVFTLQMYSITRYPHCWERKN